MVCGDRRWSVQATYTVMGGDVLVTFFSTPLSWGKYRSSGPDSSTNSLNLAKLSSRKLSLLSVSSSQEYRKAAWSQHRAAASSSSKYPTWRVLSVWSRARQRLFFLSRCTPLYSDVIDVTWLGFSAVRSESDAIGALFAPASSVRAFLVAGSCRTSASPLGGVVFSRSPCSMKTCSSSCSRISPSLAVSLSLSLFHQAHSLNVEAWTRTCERETKLCNDL